MTMAAITQNCSALKFERCCRVLLHCIRLPLAPTSLRTLRVHAVGEDFILEPKVVVR